MKSKKYPTVLSAIALLLVLMIAPVSTAAFAQNTDVDEPDTQTAIDDIEVTTDSDEDDNAVNDEDVETDVEETDESVEDQRKDLREQHKEDRKAIKDYYKDERKNLKDQYKDQRTDLKEQYKDRLRDSNISVVRPVPIDPDRMPDVTFEGGTNGYALLGGQAWESYITLDGSAYHVHNGMWKVKTSGEISVAGKIATLDLKGFAKGNKLILHGNGILDGDQKIRLSLKGFFAPTGNSEDTGVFAIAFTQAGVHNINTGERLHLMQVGEVTVTPTGDSETDFTTESIPFETLS
jgi:hypothetical protein